MPPRVRGERQRRSLSRSEIMARVRRRDTRPELMVRRALHALGMRFRVDHRVEGIHADIVFPVERVAVFIDGCFWHGCPVHATRPKSNTAYWLPKLDENLRRDRRQTARLRRQGWTVIRVWEHVCRAPLGPVVDRIAAMVHRRRIRSVPVTRTADGPT